jgi:subtilisin family serine protease
MDGDEGHLFRNWMLALSVGLLVIIIAFVILEAPNEQVDRSDWAYEMVQLDEARGAGYTGEGIRVAIVDTGIDIDHPVLEDADLVAWKDLIGNRKEPYDDEGHGTAMASIIVGRGPLVGGAVDVELIVVKAMDGLGESSDELVAQGIMYSLDPNDDGDYRDGADVISLSLGGRVRYLAQIFGTESQDAIEEATENGVIVVAAAGNDGESDDGDVATPGWIREVISVGAVDINGDLASFSSRGRVIAVTLSAVPELAHNGHRGGEESTVILVKDGIMETANPLTTQTLPHDNRAGYGIIQTMDLIGWLEARL